MSGGILDSFQTIIPTAAAVLSEIEALDMDVSKFYHGDYYLEELKTIEGK